MVHLISLISSASMGSLSTHKIWMGF